MTDTAEVKNRHRGDAGTCAMRDVPTPIIGIRPDLTLLTTDKDFSAVPDLKWENWLA
ncbi:MAG: type II toxin-antitoxin system VapC family toxin [Armatimonadetes bacterium]|nr:type II toxin-antitoxin system VapC family toxin [Armatimonadota bacterium]